MAQLVSNIKVIPSFPETAFFSGDEFNCTLTFKNVADPSPSSLSSSIPKYENLRRGSRILNSKRPYAEWLSERGRSASEGLPVTPSTAGARKSSAPTRSLSDAGSEAAESKPDTPPSQEIEPKERETSLSSASETVTFDNQNLFQENEGIPEEVTCLSN
jgi:hypothetical protein